MERRIRGLSQEALDWTPELEMNSICALVVHLTDAGRYWIDDVAAGGSFGRDRAEFRAEGLAGFESVKSKFRQGFILLSTNQTEPPNLCVRKSQPDQAQASTHPPPGEECLQPQP